MLVDDGENVKEDSIISEDGNEDDFKCEHLTSFLSRELQAIEKLEEDTNEFVDEVMRFLRDIASIESKSKVMIPGFLEALTDSQGEKVSQRTSCIGESR